MKASLQLGRVALIPGIFGLATHKVYPPHALLHDDVSSYLTFSPFPAAFLQQVVVFCDPLCQWSSLSIAHPFGWYGTLCCPDFPHKGV